MREDIEDLGPVQWIRDLFENATAESMYRWMLVAWVVAVAAFVALDRVSSMLLGRSRPTTQRPPELARKWRWRKQLPPATYSMLPSGTLATPRPLALPASIPLSTRNGDSAERLPELPMLTRASVPESDYWEDLASVSAPLFGYENNPRLELGRPPERYNPIRGRVEALRRDTDSGAVSWFGDDGVAAVTVDLSPPSDHVVDPRVDNTAVFEPSDADRAVMQVEGPE